MSGIVVSGEDCAASQPGRKPCTAGEFKSGTNEVDPESQPFGVHCDHWYEDEGCCYCGTDTLNLVVIGE